MKLSFEDIEALGFKTQREFAQHVGWTEEHVSRVLKGRKPTTLLLQRYVEAATGHPQREEREP